MGAGPPTVFRGDPLRSIQPSGTSDSIGDSCARTKPGGAGPGAGSREVAAILPTALPTARTGEEGPRVELEETSLPGIGLRHDFQSRSGRRVGVLSHRDGTRELVFYRSDDPDAVSSSVHLTTEESDTLAELLGAPRIVERLAKLVDQVEGITSETLLVTPGSAYDGRMIADTAARTRTGASIVAVSRRREVVPSPPPEFRFAGGDRVVVVGTPEGIAAVREILDGTAGDDR
jgi:TrkA domain protein